MRTLGLITARGGSKGVPHKNIKNLGGKPLISYVIADALEAKFLSRVIVSTDCEEIASIAIKCGAEVPFLRPKELAQDDTASLDVVIHVVNELERRQEFYDAICLLQPTSPFKPKGFIDNCIEKFISLNADTLISVQEVPHIFNPHWVFEMSDQQGLLKIATGDEKIIPRRQELPTAFFRDGSVYIFKRENPMEGRELITGRISFVLSDIRYYSNIDSYEDWSKAEATLQILRNDD